MALRIVFNPLSGGFDYVNSDTAPIAAKYTDTFNATTDWTLNVDQYELSILAATHGVGVNPMIQVMEFNGSDYDNVMISIKVNNSGDVTLIVNSSPDLRFQGKVVIF